VIACSQCGRTPEGDADEIPFDWTVERDRGRVMAVCPECTRRHARAIEGKLDQAWW
jgi:hypothetical protein